MLSILLFLGSAMAIGAFLVCLYALASSNEAYRALNSRPAGDIESRMENERTRLKKALMHEIDSLSNHEVTRYVRMLKHGRYIL